MSSTRLDAILTELEGLGTEQNRTVYGRHGVTGAMFGVSFANLDRIAKRVKVDHELALALWLTGNHDARQLAVRIADPAALTVAQADAWARDCDNYVAAETVAGIVARSPIAHGRAAAWRDRKGEWVAAAGWSVTTRLAMAPDGLDGDACATLVEQIEREIGDRPNRVRHEMNMALIAIGSRGDPVLRARVLDLAERLGPIAVDHGATGCKTPPIAAYIAKIEQRRAKRAART